MTASIDQHPDLYVAMLLPNCDGSGTAIVLGVYSTRDGAEARCWRALQSLGYDQPTAVVERSLDLGHEGDGASVLGVEHHSWRDEYGSDREGGQ